MQVLKFGGTSVNDAKAISQVVSIVADQLKTDPNVVVVTSAMRGVTDLLIDSAKAAAKGDRQRYRDARLILVTRHHDAAEALVGDLDDLSRLLGDVDERIREFERLCMAVAILGELTDRGLAVISGLGERLLAPILAAAIRARGIKAEFVDAGELIVTDDNHASAAPDMDATRAATRGRLLPLLEAGSVPVVTGFVAATPDGVPTVLGRGGSDYSAAILGAAVDADEIQIWTDVDGVLTADPRIVKDARPLPELTYSEAAELAYFGAKVLHPKTMLPAIDRGIPISVRNTFNPAFPGTRVVAQTKNGGTVKALTVIRGLALVTVAGRGMMGVPGIARAHLCGRGGPRRQCVDDLPGIVRAKHLLRRAGSRCCACGAGVGGRIRRRDPSALDRPRGGGAADRDRGGGRRGDARYPRYRGEAVRRAGRAHDQRDRRRPGLIGSQHLAGAGRSGRGCGCALSACRVWAGEGMSNE